MVHVLTMLTVLAVCLVIVSRIRATRARAREEHAARIRSIEGRLAETAIRFSVTLDRFERRAAAPR